MPPKKRVISSSSSKEGDDASEYTLPRAIEERLMNDQGLDFVIGVDEAGRGPLAGPVVAGACVFLTSKELISGVKDSKQIDEKGREALYEILSNRTKDIIWGIGEIDNHRIDEINVLQSTFEAMTMAVEQVVQKLSKVFKEPKFHILIDGNKVPPQLGSKYACTAVIKGDGKEFIIGAASVFAKVTRDAIMYKQHEKYPQYNFAQHKGYGTASHFQAVYKHGPCEYHRFTFAPIKHMDLDKNKKLIQSKSNDRHEGNKNENWGKDKTSKKNNKDNESKASGKKTKVDKRRGSSIGKIEVAAKKSKKTTEPAVAGVRRSSRLRN